MLVGLIAGAIGGFLGYLLQESQINYSAFIHINGRVEDMPAWAVRTLIFCVGGAIGLFLGTVDGIVEGNPRKLLRGLLLGTVSGIFLGGIGFYLGNLFFSLLGGNPAVPQETGMFSFIHLIIARSFGWSMLGLALGAGSALATFSTRRVFYGAIGGFLGGFLGGFVFDLVAVGLIPAQQAVGASGVRDIGGPSRMIGFTVIGALSGFFIGLVNELMKDAWVKVLAGRNEGKEYLLAKPINILGRDERCDVPLFGDMSIATQHAAIRADGNRHILIDAGSPAGTVVNGQRIPPAGELLLRDGDMIQISAQRILFREKATQSNVARPATDVPKSRPGPASAVPMPSNLCPYCGAPKDPSGGCLCTVGAGAGPGAPVGAASPGMGAAPSGYGTLPSPAMGGANPASVGGRSTFAPLAAATAPVAGLGTEARQLVGIDGPYAGQVFPLAGPNMTVGRDTGRDIALSADNTVSRTHARIAQEGGQVVVYDEGSSNGTFVNGMRLPAQAPQTLAPGDVVQFGSSRFRFE